MDTRPPNHALAANPAIVLWLAAIAAFVICLALVAVWFLLEPLEPPVQVRGPFTEQDISELTRLGKVENRRDIKSDWSRSRGDVQQMIRVLRRFISDKVVRIDRTPDNKAVVTIVRSTTRGRTTDYLYVRTQSGWKHEPPRLRLYNWDQITSNGFIPPTFSIPFRGAGR